MLPTYIAGLFCGHTSRISNKYILNPYLEGAKHLVRLIAFSLKNSETEILERKHYATDMHRLLRGSRTFDQNDGCKMCRGSLVCNLSFIQIWLFIGMNVRKNPILPL